MRWIKHLVFIFASVYVFVVTLFPHQTYAFLPVLFLPGEKIETSVESYIEIEDHFLLEHISTDTPEISLHQPTPLLVEKKDPPEDIQIGSAASLEVKKELIEIALEGPVIESSDSADITSTEEDQFETVKFSTPSAEVEDVIQPEPIEIPTYDLEQPLHELFQKWADHFGVDKEKLHTIAQCESGHNATSLSGNGLYAGMFQFSDSTWQSTRNQMSHDPNPDLRFNPEEAVKTAAFKIASGGEGAWKACLPK